MILGKNLLIVDYAALFNKMTQNFIYEYPLCVPMTSINISIKQDAYNFLQSLKTGNKSFSDVILEFKKDNIMRFFGVLKDLDWDKKEKQIVSLRQSFKSRLR